MKKKSVTIQLQGGVGNQLFQFAAALFLADLRMKKLELDFGLTSKNSHLGTTISHIKIFKNKSDEELQIEVKNSEKVKNLKCEFAGRIRSRIDRLTGVTIIQNNEVGFDEKIITSKRISRMRGYFQSYYYIEELIKKGVVSKSDLLQEMESTDFLKIKKFILDNNPIFIHVRAGDYMELKNSIGVLSPDYYKAAIRDIPNFKERRILLFTDNFDYAANILSEPEFNFTFFPETSTMHPMELITLMSYGNDFIISNSTFSWWGAKLSSELGTIIAPIPWFKNRHQPVGLISPKWNTRTSVFLN